MFFYGCHKTDSFCRYLDVAIAPEPLSCSFGVDLASPSPHLPLHLSHRFPHRCLLKLQGSFKTSGSSGRGAVHSGTLISSCQPWQTFLSCSGLFNSLLRLVSLNAYFVCLGIENITYIKGTHGSLRSIQMLSLCVLCKKKNYFRWGTEHQIFNISVLVNVIRNFETIVRNTAIHILSIH